MPADDALLSLPCDDREKAWERRRDFDALLWCLQQTPKIRHRVFDVSTDAICNLYWNKNGTLLKHKNNYKMAIANIRIGKIWISHTFSILRYTVKTFRQFLHFIFLCMNFRAQNCSRLSKSAGNSNFGNSFSRFFSFYKQFECNF